jgi:hypothetical protein
MEDQQKVDRKIVEEGQKGSKMTHMVHHYQKKVQ